MIQSYKGLRPKVHPDAWVHPNAVLIGDVTIDAGASIWPGVVLRGDQGSIQIGPESNIQDGTIVHCTGGLSTTVVGARCTVGHRVLLHGCIIEDDCLVGMGAIVMDNAEVASFSVIGAAALVPARKTIPPRSLVLGSPGRVVRTLDDADVTRMIRHGHAEYMRLAAAYRSEAP